MSLLLKREVVEVIRRAIGKWVPIMVIGGVLLLAVAVVGPMISVMSKEEEPVMLAYVDAASMYGEFVCSCCGENIGECDCGMAAERRAYVESLAAAGLSKREIYKEMVKKYMADILFDEVLAAEIKEELVAEAPADRPILEVEPSVVTRAR